MGTRALCKTLVVVKEALSFLKFLFRGRFQLLPLPVLSSLIYRISFSPSLFYSSSSKKKKITKRFKVFQKFRFLNYPNLDDFWECIRFYGSCKDTHEVVHSEHQDVLNITLNYTFLTTFKALPQSCGLKSLWRFSGICFYYIFCPYFKSYRMFTNWFNENMKKSSNFGNRASI